MGRVPALNSLTSIAVGTLAVKSSCPCENVATEPPLKLVICEAVVLLPQP